MIERDSTIGGDWLALQQKYWDAWFDLTRQTVSDSTTGDPPTPGAWSDRVLQWWSTMSPAVTPTARDFFSRTLELSQLYFRMAEQITASGLPNTGAATEQWLDHLNRTFRSITEGAPVVGDPRDQGAVAFWNLPLDTWRRTMSFMTPLPGDFLEPLKNEGVARMSAELRGRFDRFLAIPAVGYTREAQDQYQLLLRLMLEYMETLQEYSVNFARVGVRATERFRQRLAEGGAPVDSLRTLYDFWVDAFEEIYGEYIMSEEYAQLHARLGNALVAVKRQGSLIVDEVLEGMNMPTRRELNSLHQRVHELQRRNHALRDDIDSINERLAAVERPDAVADSSATAEPAEPQPQPAPTSRPRSRNRKPHHRKP